MDAGIFAVTIMEVKMQTDTETFVPLRGMDEWEAFWNANRNASECTETRALALARNQCLFIGGGASPLFRVGFVDDE